MKVERCCAIFTCLCPAHKDMLTFERKIVYRVDKQVSYVRSLFQHLQLVHYPEICWLKVRELAATITSSQDMVIPIRVWIWEAMLTVISGRTFNFLTKSFTSEIDWFCCSEKRNAVRIYFIILFQRLLYARQKEITQMPRERELLC